MYDLLLSLGWDFVIRFRGAILVTSAEGESKTAEEWVSLTGRARMLRGAKVTADQFAVPAVVVAWDRKIKEPWCLATTLSELTASGVVKRYGKRFTIEETFRDQKDLHFGMGLKATHIGKPVLTLYRWPMQGRFSLSLSFWILLDGPDFAGGSSHDAALLFGLF